MNTIELRRWDNNEVIFSYEYDEKKIKKGGNILDDSLFCLTIHAAIKSGVCIVDANIEALIRYLKLEELGKCLPEGFVYDNVFYGLTVPVKPEDTVLKLIRIGTHNLYTSAIDNNLVKYVPEGHTNFIRTVLWFLNDVNEVTLMYLFVFIKIQQCRRLPKYLKFTYKYMSSQEIDDLTWESLLEISDSEKESSYAPCEGAPICLIR